MKEDLFAKAEGIIKKISDICPEAGSILEERLNNLRGLGCSSSAETKDTAFASARKAIEKAQSLCKDESLAEDFSTLIGLVDEGVGVRCGGG